MAGHLVQAERSGHGRDRPPWPSASKNLTFSGCNLPAGTRFSAKAELAAATPNIGVLQRPLEP